MYLSAHNFLKCREGVDRVGDKHDHNTKRKGKKPYITTNNDL